MFSERQARVGKFNLACEHKRQRVVARLSRQALQRPTSADDLAIGCRRVEREAQKFFDARGGVIKSGPGKGRFLWNKMYKFSQLPQ